MERASDRALRDERARLMNRELVPFAMSIFDDQFVRGMGRARHLPVNTVECLTREALEAVARIIPPGVLGYLVRIGGWRTGSVVLDGQVVRLKLSDPRLREHISFGYGPRSIEALLFGFNAGATDNLVAFDYKWAMPFEPLHMRLTGDVLLHHIIGLKIPVAQHCISQHARQYFQDNPLTRLHRLSGSFQDLEPAVRWMLSGPLVPLLPWLEGSLRQEWYNEIDGMWRRGRGRQVAVGWANVFRTWREVATEKGLVHHLVALLELFREIFVDPHAEERWRAEFNATTGVESRKTRTHLQDRWADALDELLALERIYVELRALHPMEREVEQTMFMSGWESREMNIVARRAEAFVRELRGVIG